MDKEKYEPVIIKSLIKDLLNEKERYQQEKIAHKIGDYKTEYTALCVTELLYSADAYVRNVAIEILVSVGENSLQVLKNNVLNKDADIRKFSLDVLKNIPSLQSCEIAVAALDDLDKNVVEAAIEVLAEQHYIKAYAKLLDMLKKTSSVWIINAIIRALAEFKIKGASGEIEEKIASLNTSTVEKSILINTFVKALGTIGIYQDIEKIIDVYQIKYKIDNNNLIWAIGNLVLNYDVLLISQVASDATKSIFEEYQDYSNTELTLILIEASVKLHFTFFLKRIKEIILLHKDEEFFAENLIDIICSLDDIPSDSIIDMIKSDVRELMLAGLEIIYRKQISGFNSIVEELCSSDDSELSEAALKIITDIDGYRNFGLIKTFMDCNEEAGKAAIEGIDLTDSQTPEFLYSKLEHQSKKVRKSAAEKLLTLSDMISVNRLEEIVMHNQGEESNEALTVIFKFDKACAWKYISSRMDNADDKVRASLVDIIESANDCEYYSFMDTMINDTSSAVRKKTIRSLSSRVNDKSLDMFKILLKNDTVVENMVEIVSTLYRFNNEKALNMVIDSAKSGNILIRLAAARSLGHFNDERANIMLREMLDDEVEDVKETSEESLKSKGVLK